MAVYYPHSILFTALTCRYDLHRVDLKVANYVHLMEPQWNPMLEEQALDRVHRIGQTRDVVTFRYVVKDSIENVSFLLYSTLSFTHLEAHGAYNLVCPTVSEAQARLD